MSDFYCNITTDPLDRYSELNRFRRFETLNGFVPDAGSVYKLTRCGFIEMVYEDGEKMEAEASETSTPAAGKFSYVSAEDILYIRMSDSAAPSTHTVEAGKDWNAFLTRLRADAQEYIETRLSSVLDVPFLKIHAAFQSYNGRSYDADLRHATADLIVFYVISTIEPQNELGKLFLNRVDLPNIDPNFQGRKGFIQRILGNELTLRIQRSNRQAGGWDVVDGDGNTTGVFLLISGAYTGTEKQLWRVEIDTAGAPGTATFKIRFGDTLSFDKTGQATRVSGSENRRISLGDGVWAEFLTADGVNYALGDLWDIWVYPAADRVQQGATGRIYFPL